MTERWKIYKETGTDYKQRKEELSNSVSIYESYFIIRSMCRHFEALLTNC